MPPSPTQPRRSAIPRSFRRPSLNPTTQCQSQDDKERDLAVAADGSFVETTSAAAARAMARFYAQQAGLAGEEGEGEGEGETAQGMERELYGVVKVEREGRTVYRIKPLARPPPSPASPASSTSSSSATHSSTSAGRLPFARPSHQPGPSAPLPVVAEPLPPSLARKGLRQSRSIPVLRSTRLGAEEEGGGGNGLLSPKDAAFPTASTSSSSSSSSNYVSPAASPPSATAQPTPTLRRPGSSPTLNRFAPSHLAPPLSSLSSAPSASSPTGRLPPKALVSASVPHLASAAPYSGGKRGRSAGPAGGGGGGPEGDVLGRILGWREGLGAESGGSGRKKGGAARLGQLPGLSSGAGAGAEAGGVQAKTSAKSEPPLTNPLLPPLDRSAVLEELDASALPPHPFAALSHPRRPSVSLTRSKTTHGPFGAGVRVPCVGTETTLRPALQERRSRSEGAEEGEAVPGAEGKKLGHAMREVSSNDSIRTATAEDPQPLAVPPSLPTLPAAPTTPLPASTKRRRFEDPTIFSVFHRLAHPSSPSPSPLASPSSSSSPRVSDVPPAPFGTHGRLPSSTSLASTASHTSSTSQADSASAHRITIATAAPGDDPRFCIWGYRDPPSSASSTAQHQHPGSPPQQHARRNSGAAPSTPARSAGGDLRRQSIAEEEAPVGPSSPAPSSSPATSSRRWSVSQRGASSSSAGGAGVSSPATSVRDSVDSGAGGQQNQRRILMAATVERLIAELTSEISAELLPEVFLTFRHYVSPLDLLRLLLTRFEWAMTPPSPLEPLTSAQAAEDDALRRVVRVRTFVVLRYWLLNHFMEDFYPHREVRTTLTTWLNTAGRDDDRFKSSPKDMRLVKQLKKTVRRCKETYVLGAAVPPPPPPAAPVQPAEPTVAPIAEEDVDLSDEASALPPPPTAPMHPPTAPASSPSFGFSSLRSRSRSGKLFPSACFSGPPPAATPSDPHEGAGADPFVLPGSSGSQNAIARSFSSAMGTFGRLKRRIAAGAAGGRSGSTASGGSASGVGGGIDDRDRDRGALELERSEGGDLLWVKGGLERYLEYWGIEREAEADGEEGEKEQQEEKEEGTPTLVADSPAAESGASSSDAATPRPDFSGAATAEPVVVGAEQHAPVGRDNSGVGLGLGLEVVSSSKEAVSDPAVAAVDYAFPPRSTSPATTAPPIPLFDPASYDAPPSQPPAPAYTFTLDRSSFAPRPSYGHPQSHFARPHSTRIELDDLDDSSDDDEDVVEVKKTLKRLPAATNLRLAAAVGGPGTGIPPHHLQRSPYRRSMDSELSYGFSTAGGIGGLGAPWNPDDDAPRESVLFVDDEDGYGFGPGGEPVTVIPNFILDGLLSDDEDDEPGDVEAALRRLEGLVDDAKERDKARRVEKQMEKSSRLEERRRKRLARIEAGEEVGFDEEDEEDGEAASTPSREGSRKPSLAASVEVDEPVVNLPLMAPSKQEQPVKPAPVIDTIPPSAPPPSSPTPAPAPPTGYASSQSPPLSRLQFRRTADPSHSSSFRKPSISRIFGVRPLSTRPAAPAPSAGLAAPSSSTAPPTHRSFLLFCRTELLAQQFTLIERDLLRMLSYQELVSGSWREQVVSGETDALDWEAYLKERRRSDLLAKQRGAQPRSAVQDIIARFNLTANWTASEILLTASVEERAILIAKFIRLAFKCYCQHNFQTLTQIIHGLQIPHVERLRKTWAKVPAWEMRKFRGMKEFCSHLKNFKHLREVTSALLSEYGAPGQHSSFADAIGAGAASKGCIPFLGLLLRDLALNAELPTFLDPSSPNTPASVSPSGSLLSLSSPSFSSFPPLPPLPAGVELAPLVNVHKFRLLAATVQRVVAFQELAGRYGAEPSPREYFRCLKIRCLEQGVMGELSARLEA